MEQLLTGSLALLPLAPLTDEAKEVLPNVVERMRGRIQQETTPAQGTELWAATFLLMGLRFEGAFIEQLLKGVQGMEESTTYQLLIERGEAKGEAKWRRKEAHELLLRIGNGRLGKPSADIREALNVASLEELEQMADRLLQVESWAELLPSRRRVKL